MTVWIEPAVRLTWWSPWSWLLRVLNRRWYVMWSTGQQDAFDWAVSAHVKKRDAVAAAARKTASTKWVKYDMVCPQCKGEGSLRFRGGPAERIYTACPMCNGLKYVQTELRVVEFTS